MRSSGNLWSSSFIHCGGQRICWKQKMAPPPSKDLPTAVNKRVIPPNSVIQTTSHQYIVQKQLGSGSFGDVYCVERKRDRLRMAVKIEWVKEGVDQRLPKMKRSQPSDLKNLLNYYDYGGVGGTCNFLFLPLLGASLKELLGTKTPTYCTSIQLSIQTLRSIRSFHKLGRIHRDIKPSNFVQGREDDTNTIYLIDFGMAVRFCTDPTKMPRLSAYSFIGTKVYASRATHKRKPQTRRDDMESWFFVALETFDRDILPWLKADISKIPSMKDTLFEYCPQAVFDKLPDCFESFARMIDLIGDFSTPNYEFFLNMLTTHAKERDLDLEAPFEWLPKNAKAEKPRSPKKEISFGIKNPKGKSKVSAKLEVGEPDKKTAKQQKIRISGTFKYQPRAATPIPKTVKWFANELERKVEKGLYSIPITTDDMILETADKKTQESTPTSDLHLRTFFCSGSNDSSKTSGLNGLFSSDSTVSQPNKTVSLHPSALFSNGNSDSTLTVPSSMDVSAQTSWISIDGKSTSALRLAAAESADGRELIGKLGANGSLSSYVKLLELIADDYVRLQQTSSVDYQ
ncbi:Protein kinase domain-containing protein [Aphelenchoides besseyi]|nr:Protein kinase domain-containing protein [Aphelenchoides besseyi]